MFIYHPIYHLHLLPHENLASEDGRKPKFILFWTTFFDWPSMLSQAQFSSTNSKTIRRNDKRPTSRSLIGRKSKASRSLAAHQAAAS